MRPEREKTDPTEICEALSNLQDNMDEYREAKKLADISGGSFRLPPANEGSILAPDIDNSQQTGILLARVLDAHTDPFLFGDSLFRIKPDNRIEENTDRFLAHAVNLRSSLLNLASCFAEVNPSNNSTKEIFPIEVDEFASNILAHAIVNSKFGKESLIPRLGMDMFDEEVDVNKIFSDVSSIARVLLGKPSESLRDSTQLELASLVIKYFVQQILYIRSQNKTIVGDFASYLRLNRHS